MGVPIREFVARKQTLRHRFWGIPTLFGCFRAVRLPLYAEKLANSPAKALFVTIRRLCKEARFLRLHPG
jgi:hypothetical protein